MAELQTIQARHGVATFVPAGQVIKIINTTGGQVVDTWAFALPKPTPKEENQEDDRKAEKKADKLQKAEEGQQEENKEEEEKPKEEKTPAKAKATPKKNGKKNDMGLPSQEEAEKATKEGIEKGEEVSKDAQQQTPNKKTWGSYVPRIGWSSKKGGAGKEETQQQKDSNTWASYFPSGKGFSTYIPKSASDTVSAFTASHQRDLNKTYIEQLQDFSKTPVGAAGFAAITGSGYGSSLFAGYQAYNAANAPNAPAMEYLSMPHTRAATLHIRPQVNDLLVSNLREPMLTMVEDSSSGIHDTLIAACDPQRYKGLGVEEWEKHGSCAENLVLALKELNQRAGLKGAKGVGADVTVNSVPAPLNLFMNIPWNDAGDVSFDAPKNKEGDYVRLRAERDLVVVMSACPQDVLDINNNKPTDAHFLVEDDSVKELPSRTETPKKSRPTPRKLNSSASRAPSTVATGDLGDDDKSRVGSTPAKKPVPKRKTVTAPAQPKAKSESEGTATPAKKPAATPKKKPAASQPAAQTPKQEPATNGDATPAPPTTERKKPRKLSVKPKETPAPAE